MTEEFDLIEYHGFRDIFIGLYKGKEQYYLIYGTTGKPSMNLVNDNMEVHGGWANPKLFTFNCNQELAITIPFVNKNGALSHVVSINGPAEYKRIVDVLETIL